MPKHLTDVTRDEWFACEYPGNMMGWLKTADSRKMRLFACASCRQVWETMAPASRELVEAAERWADGHITRNELNAIRERIDAAIPRDQFGGIPREERAALATATPRKTALDSLIGEVAVAKAGPFDGAGIRAVHVYHARALHDIFDNLFFRVAVDAEWLTSTVVALARGIYEDKAFDRMPILADALQDAGCGRDEVLNHCRDADQLHVRGCWVLDLVLGKE